LIEKHVQVLAPTNFLRRHGIGIYSSMATLGYKPDRSSTCAS
jgi:hypothetical protein